MKEKLLVVSILVLVWSGVHAGETYRWEDADGNVYYSDSPPPADARNIGRKRLDRGVPTASLPYELQAAVSEYPVTLYVTDCGDPCDNARELLIERGVPHTLLDAMKPDVRRKLKALPGGKLEVPVAEVGYIVLRGFGTGRWNSALDLAGYPRDAMIAVTPTVPLPDETASVGSDPDDADDVDSDDEDPDDFDAEDFDADDISSADDETEFEDDL